jgi:hypothetical protein
MVAYLSRGAIPGGSALSRGTHSTERTIFTGGSTT